MAQKKIQKKAKSTTNAKKTTVKKTTKPAALSNGYKETAAATKVSKVKRKVAAEIPEESSENEIEAGAGDPPQEVRSDVESEEIPEEANPEVSVPKTASQPTTKTEKNRKRRILESVPSLVSEKSSSKTKTKKQKFYIQVPLPKTVSGKVFVVGANDVGQLGLGEDVPEKSRPALLDLPQSVVDVAAGGMHSICLTESGEVITFGCNDEGALGRSTSEEGSEYVPHKVEIAEKIVQVSAGDSHSAALSQSGQVYIWGNFRSGDGPMGLTPDRQQQNVPIRILNGVTLVRIASGSDHLACLSSDGLVYTFGCGQNGQLGRVPERWCSNGGRKGLATLLEPNIVHVSSSSKSIPIDEVWTGSYCTFLRAHGTGAIFACGLNNFTQLGYVGERASFIPKKVPSFDNRVWHGISGGQHHTLALDSEGLVFSMGRKEYGRLGLGENSDDMSSPTLIPTLENERCTNISCGNCESFAVTEQGSVFSWGFGDNQQLGHGSDEDCHVPRQIEGNFSKSWKALKVSGGGQHTLILASPRETAPSAK